MLSIEAYAKINLFLEFTGKCPNGYHTVDTIMQSVSLFDTLDIELLPRTAGIIIECDESGVPNDERNIAYKAAKAFLSETDLQTGVRIKINKRIPFAAGLGGGSSDGAAVLLSLNQLCSYPFSEERLCSVASTLGADVPFFVKGGTWRLDGIGTDFREKLNTPDLYFVIVKPDEGISTPVAYKLLDRLHNDFSEHAPKTPEGLINAFEINDPMVGAELYYNRFEEILETLSPQSFYMLNYLKNISHAALLSGSGSAIFAVAESEREAFSIKNKLALAFPDCFSTVVRTTSVGYNII